MMPLIKYALVSLPESIQLRYTQATIDFKMIRSVKLLTVLLAVITFGCRKTPDTTHFSIEEDTKMVKAILKNIDDYTLDLDTKMSVYSEDVVHMAQGSRAITNKVDLRKVLEAEYSYGHSVMTHEIVTLHAYHDMVLTRGKVTGSYHPGDGSTPIPFETNNIITFRRMADGTLKVWQVIFNRVSLEKYNG
jgi:ketosteroid isomerase-like protein